MGERKDNNQSLAHFGVLGMKWGVRRNPRMLTAKRQLAADKKVKDFLDKGGHTSVGFTKKRQAAYDSRDKKIVEDRIAKNEKRLVEKALKKAEKVKVKEIKNSKQHTNGESWFKEAGKLMKNQYAHPILTERADRASKKADTFGNRLRRNTIYQNTKDLKDVNSRIEKMLADKRR